MRRLPVRVIVLVRRGVHHAQISGIGVVLVAVEAVLMRLLLLVGEQAGLLLGLLVEFLHLDVVFYVPALRVVPAGHCWQRVFIVSRGRRGLCWRVECGCLCSSVTSSCIHRRLWALVLRVYWILWWRRRLLVSSLVSSPR